MAPRRHYYLEDLPLDEANARFFGALREAGALDPAPSESIPLELALGRVTAAPVWARVSSPHYHAAAMDGIAVRAVDTLGATETAPVRLTDATQYQWVDTGDPLPPGFNAVVMAEVVHQVDGTTIEVQAPVAPWQHLRPLGEDIVATELVLPENHRLRPQDLGAIASSGLTHVEVRRKPKVAIIPTGTELVAPGSTLKPGDIVESNSLVLAGMVEEWGGIPVRLPPVADVLETLRGVVQQALVDNDIVIINAGSSAGEEDFTATVVEELGSVLVHGVAVRPGHPVVLGLAAGKAVVGIPGYPVSAVLTCELFVKPLLEHKLGLRFPARPTIKAAMTRKVLSPMGEDEYMRVKLGRVDGRLVATPLQRGAGVLMSMVRADGIVRIPRFSEGVHAGAEVDVELLRTQDEVEHTIVAIGSHDMALDVLASHLRRIDSSLTLSSSNVGSLGGLLTLRRGEAHLAGSHLLDEATGEYNVSYVKQYLPGVPVVLLHLVGRVQGLMVPRGNPKSIKSLEDLARDDVSFINRQRGSGTRVLLDYKLKELGIDAESVVGYEREEYTHTGVAAAVASGTADTGLGILAASRALDLDFVPLLQEQYDLVIPRSHYDSELLQPLIAAIRGDAFRDEVAALGGYDVSRTGEVIAEIS